MDGQIEKVVKTGDQGAAADAEEATASPIEVREIPFASVLDLLNGSYAGNVPACS